MTARDPLVWLHCGDTANVAVTLSLAHQLVERDDPVRVHVTAPTRERIESRWDGPQGAVTFGAPPPDQPTALKSWFEDTNPAALAWFGGVPKQSIASTIQKAGLPALLVNLGQEDLMPKGLAWRGRAMRSTFAVFQRIFVTDGATSVRLQRIGIDRAQIEISGPLREEAKPPHHDPNELIVMAETIGSRPCWYASHAVPGEVVQLVHAHRAAARRGHRLLMLISPRNPANGPDFGERLRKAGLRVGVRSLGDEPIEDIQAYVTDLEGEDGLWLRLAPLTFMGGTLSGPDGLSPFLPASVGSALLHGPFTKPWSDQYGRLGEAGATRKVRSGTELGAALGELMAPDRFATMAHAGWQEVTRSADSLNRLLDMIDAGLSGQEVS